MSELRVAYFIESLGPGGAERSLAEMLPLLRRLGVTVRVFVLYEQARGFGQLVLDTGVEVECLPQGGWWRRVRSLRRRLREWRPHLLHTTLYYADLFGRLAAVGSGVPVLSSLVNSGYAPERFSDPRIRAWRLRILQQLDGWTARHLTAHMHAVSQAAKDSAVRHLRLEAERITVVRRGRDLGRFPAPTEESRAAARRRWGVADGERLLVNVGRQTFPKGQLVLLDAVRRLLETGRRVRLIIAGSQGPCTPELAAFVDEHRLAESVRLAGHVDDIPELLTAADVFAFPSRFEGFPGAVLEAIAAGVPVVGSAIPPLEELFADGRGAILVEPGSAEHLAGAIDRVLSDDELRRELGADGRELFVENFDLEKTVPPLVDLYRKVAVA